MPLGNRDSLFRHFTTDIITDQMIFAKFHSRTQGGKEVQYYLLRCRLDATTPLRRVILASGS